MVVHQEHGKKCLLIKKLATCKMPQLVVVYSIIFASEHPLAL